MRKIFISLFFLLMPAASFAGTVNEKQAENFARQYMGTGVLRSEKTSLTLRSKAAATPAYYIFNNPDGGWVIVAGDDRVTPVLAHCDTGCFKVDGMPENLSAWMKNLEKAIVSVRENPNVQQSARVKRAWAMENAPRAYTSVRKTLSTALWDQGNPYNSACNTACGETVNTGSVATAIAIVLRYNKWPEKAKGTIPAYTTGTKGYKVSEVNIDGYTYNWTNMPTSDGNKNTWTNSQKKAVSDLIFHCGAMVKMDYTSDESKANTFDIIPALCNYMSYSKSARFLSRKFYTLEQWADILRGEIDANRPVLYSGSGSEGEHQFVCDGYDSGNGEFHFNWGWGGTDNGMFTIDLDAVDLGDDHEIVVGLVKDDSTEVSEPSEIALVRHHLRNGSEVGDGIVLLSGNVVTGTSFCISAGYIANYSLSQYSGQVKAALVSGRGVLKEYISEPVSINISSIHANEDLEMISSLSCKITCNIDFGDRIVLYFKDAASGNWLPVRTEMNNFDFAPYLPVYDVPYIIDKGTYSTSDRYYFNLSRGQRKISSVKWYCDGALSGEDNQASVQLQTAGVHVMKAMITYLDGTSETITKNVTVE